ncbi:MAG: hypothetical protein ACTHOH_13935 [Lysobacteraceae bacterium]
MNAPVPSPGPIETRDTAAPAQVEPGIVEANTVEADTVEANTVEIRYADYRPTLSEVLILSSTLLIGYVVPHFSNLPQQQTFVWFAIACSVAVFNGVWALLRFRKAGPAMTLDGDGLHSTPWLGERVDVRWDEIEWCDAFHRGGKTKRPYLGVRLKHPEQRIPPWDMASDARRPHLWILSEGLQLSTKDLVARIRDYRVSLGR